MIISDKKIEPFHQCKLALNEIVKYSSNTDHHDALMELLCFSVIDLDAQMCDTISTLFKVITEGPCKPEDIPPSNSTQALLDLGFIVKVVVKNESGWCAGTEMGRDVLTRIMKSAHALNVVLNS